MPKTTYQWKVAEAMCHSVRTSDHFYVSHSSPAHSVKIRLPVSKACNRSLQSDQDAEGTTEPQEKLPEEQRQSRHALNLTQGLKDSPTMEQEDKACEGGEEEDENHEAPESIDDLVQLLYSSLPKGVPGSKKTN